MGLNLSDLGPVYIVCGKTDLRKVIDLKLSTGMVRVSKRFENGQLTWSRNTSEVQNLMPEQVEWLIKDLLLYLKLKRIKVVIFIEMSAFSGSLSSSVVGN